MNIKTAKKKYKYFLFDWDGCIVNSLPVWFICFHNVFKKSNIVMTDLDILSISTHNSKKTTDFGMEPSKFNELMEIEAIKYMPIVRLNPGVISLLKLLHKQDVKIGLVTSSYKKTIIPMLSKLEINQYFDVLITADDVIKPKPSTEPIDKAIEQLGGDVESTLIVGDSDNDIIPGKKLNIDTVLFAPKSHNYYHKIDSFIKLKPKYIITKFSELNQIISTN
ncbi:MAG: HAD-IA family hydrolase [bacterium]|nr:HAD-IA family hydrolase [bacterium]